MANPTTNFGWVMPTSASLVTNLPADFNTFGQAVDTSMAQLKGGTTGQILSKTSGTDMAFTWITPNPGDITAITATSPLTGGGTSGDVTIGILSGTTSNLGAVQLSTSTSSTSTSLAATASAVKSAYDLANAAVPNSIVNAKGDLIGASANDTPAILSVGNNGETLVADSSTSTGLRYQTPVQQNPVINSALQIWQRGTSFTVTPSSGTFYSADRWQTYSAATGRTVSRQLTNDTTNLPNIQYCFRAQRDSGNTATNFIQTSNMFETINTIPYVGKTVTYSFYARAGANFSAASSNLGVQLVTGTGTDQNATGYTGAATPINSTATLTTTWQRFSFTTSIATTVTEMSLSTYYTPVGTAGTNDYYEFTGVQLEVGSVATPFHTYAATIQGELAACQRYYVYDGKVGVNAYVGSGTNCWGLYQFPTTMRITPTMTQTGGATASQNTSATTFTQDTSNSNTFKMGLYFLAGASTTTTYLYRVVEWSAEL